MTTRFTETEKWNDPWFRKLTPAAKCLWEYMRDNCNDAGILEWDHEDAMFRTGLKLKDLVGACKDLERGYIAAQGHLMLRTFLKHQKNVPFNERNPAHRGILRRLGEASEIFPSALDDLNKRGVLQIQEGACKGLLSPIGIGNGKGKGIGNGKSIGNSKGRVSVNTDMMQRLGLFLSRKPTTLWSVKEADALKALGALDPDEIDLLEDYYRADLPAEMDIRRRDLITMLNNWTGEIDRAREFWRKHAKERRELRDSLGKRGEASW
jgi:hypothetical protein